MRKAEVMEAARISPEVRVPGPHARRVYRSVYHFVVIDPVNRKIGLYEDSTSPFQKFNNRGREGRRGAVARLRLARAPSGVSSLPDPFGGSDITSAWTIPAA